MNTNPSQRYFRGDSVIAVLKMSTQISSHVRVRLSRLLEYFGSYLVIGKEFDIERTSFSSKRWIAQTSCKDNLPQVRSSDFKINGFELYIHQLPREIILHILNV